MSLLILVCLSANLFAQITIPAFPTAEGYGMFATGGRGGEVVVVTNLEDDAKGETKGSLRWALNQHLDKPTTIVFRVSGIINLVTDLRSKRTAGTTIAGQTAPGDGICIRGGKVNFGGCENLVIRHLRFRIGLDDEGKFIKGGSIGIENANNFIIDHCTFGWSSEENMTMYDNKKSTVQWSIIHEGLYSSGHGKGARSYGAQWGGETATYHHNLLAHNISRTPRFNGTKHNDVNVQYEYVNNVNYNWGKATSAYGAYVEIDGTYQCNMINNYYKPGPAYPDNLTSYFAQSSYAKSMGNTRIAKWYMKGNYMEGKANSALNSDNYKGLDASGYTENGVSKSLLVMPEPFKTSHTLKIESATNAYKSVLIGAGAFPRDTVDRRIVNEVRTGTASGKGTNPQYRHNDEKQLNNPYYAVAKGIIDNPILAFGNQAYPEYKTYNTIVDNDQDGMDDAWEIANGLNPQDASDRNKKTVSGYTCLEVYLNSLVGEKINLEF
ncbi:pectate lyase family protein [Pedobacter alpinus]|uniref:Polysaccharide lyase family 1 protein n=1 Tax=Pedobacter alpinus TaxID=1590643 RepID=A0ABW5TS15_9SPHI